MASYTWAVIGAGPAGIAAVGNLLDYGVLGSEILWIDPQFTVGDFGSRWKNIPSNTKVQLFLKFLHACDAFSYSACDQSFELNKTPAEETCLLSLMVEPLQWVTKQLQSKVDIKKDFVENLRCHFRDGGNPFKMDPRRSLPSNALIGGGDDNQTHLWHLKLSHEHVYAKNVVLAIGAEPKTLAINSCPVIPLQHAMDSESIKNHLKPHDVVAVFGSSHSAVLALKNLVDCSAKKIINFYRSPLIYAIYTDNGILFDDTGLKGSAAEWSRENLHETLPLNLLRVESNDDMIQTYLPECTKVVYAVGFERRLISIEGFRDIQYDNKTGMIAPGLFGFGIAFPEAKTNHLGLIEHSVGLWKFMTYLKRVMPVWLQHKKFDVTERPSGRVTVNDGDAS
jgi:hypothetical protein